MLEALGVHQELGISGIIGSDPILDWFDITSNRNRIIPGGEIRLDRSRIRMP
jgi:hypothetical protein